MSNNVYTKLAQARVNLQNTELKKSGYNSFSKYHYFELKDFLPTLNKILNDLKLLAVFNLYDDKATLTVINCESQNEIIEFETPTAEADIKGAQAIQKLGGVHTYLKRYLYNNAFEIAENDLIDATPQDKKKQDKKTEVQARDKVVKLVNSKKLDITKISNSYGLGKETLDEEFEFVYEELLKMSEEQLKELK